MKRTIGRVAGTNGLGTAGFALFVRSETSQLPLEAGTGEEAAQDSPPDDTSRASCEGLVATLRLHIREGSAGHPPLGEGTPVDTLLATAAEARASVLVMGAYGHGKLPEMVFGGFTRSVLGGAAMAALMIHCA